MNTERAKLEPLTPNTSNESSSLLEQVEAITEAIPDIPISGGGFKYEIHPVANMLEEYDTTTLKESVREHGLFQPVLLWWDKVSRKWYLVDGRHRVKVWYELAAEGAEKAKGDIPVHKLDEKTTLEMLPKVILEAQIIGRALDEICANCEATLYLRDNKGKAKALEEAYDILNSRTISDLKTILEVRPIWFSTLRNGDFVEPAESEGTTKSIQKLAKLCRAERDKSKPNTDEEPGDESVAIAFSKMKPQVEAILSLVGKDDTMLYALTQLIKQGTKDFSDDYCLTIPEKQIQEQEQTINDDERSVKVLMEHIENLESELKTKDKLLEDFITSGEKDPNEEHF